jgi:hypothetical protein
VRGRQLIGGLKWRVINRWPVSLAKVLKSQHQLSGEEGPHLRRRGVGAVRLSYLLFAFPFSPGFLIIIYYFLGLSCVTFDRLAIRSAEIMLCWD